MPLIARTPNALIFKYLSASPRTPCSGLVKTEHPLPGDFEQRYALARQGELGAQLARLYG